MEFDEPEATGGVPILKYKAEWRALGEGDWHARLYDAKEGRSDPKKPGSFTTSTEKTLGFLQGTAREGGGFRLEAPDKFLNICCEFLNI